MCICLNLDRKPTERAPQCEKLPFKKKAVLMNYVLCYLLYNLFLLCIVCDYATYLLC